MIREFMMPQLLMAMYCILILHIGCMICYLDIHWLYTEELLAGPAVTAG